MPKIVVGADIAPTRTNVDLFNQGKVEDLIGDKLMTLLLQSDFNILNLETPLADKETPIVKTGPCLIAPTSTIKGLKLINKDFYTLANNHILDQGQDGLTSTIETLTDHNIAFAGVGSNLKEARKSFIKELGQLTLGIYCCTENEFSNATLTSSGANPYDPLVSFDDVRNLASQCDLTIVLYHGAKEHYRYPSPRLQRVFRKFAEVGADYIIGQHSHCISCFEEYEGSLLLYGQGNFLFDYSTDEHWNTSLLLTIEVDDATKKHRYDFIPLEKVGNKVRYAEDSANDILSSFFNRSQEILNPEFLEEKYREFSQKIEIDYYYALLGKLGRCKLFRAINKIWGYKLVKMNYSVQERVLLENFITCESHHEVLLSILRK